MIRSVSTRSSRIGERVIVAGDDFGAIPGLCWIGDKLQRVVSWSDTEVVAELVEAPASLVVSLTIPVVVRQQTMILEHQIAA